MSKAELYSSPLMQELLLDVSPEEYEKTAKRMLLAARIDDAITARGWKNKDFAIAMRKTPSEISKWLSGTHNFTIDTLFEIERVLNINLFKPFEELQQVINTFRYSITSRENIPSQDYLLSMSCNEELISYKKA